MTSISVFGLGKVGLTLAACLADADFVVLGVDTNPQLLDSIMAGEFRTDEPGVTERLSRNLDRRLQVTHNPEFAVNETSVSFIVVPSPSNSLGGFSLEYIEATCQTIGNALAHKTSRHVVALVSTVLPNSSMTTLIPLLEKAAERPIGDQLGYCYNPAFIALGEVVQGFLQPDYVLVGETSEWAGDEIIAVHEKLMTKSAPIARMNPTEAEITKVASNTHETMRVSFANMLLALCTQVPGTDVDKVTGALAHRMGKRFFKGATPYGGPCWPRDNIALAAFLDLAGASSTMPKAVDRANKEHADFLLEKVLSLTKRNQNVSVVGLAYKPGTPVLDHSFPYQLAESLTREGRNVIVWDPLVDHDQTAELGAKFRHAMTLKDCLTSSEVIILANPIPELDTVDWSIVNNCTVVDCWRALPPERSKSVREYIALGRTPTPDPPSLNSQLFRNLIN